MDDNSKEQLVQEQVQQLVPQLSHLLDHRPEILFAILYGSAAEGLQFRDLDIAIFVDRERLPAKQDWDYAFELAAYIERQVPHPVDVRVVNDAPVLFRYNVSRGLPILVNDRIAFADFKEYTWIEYGDFLPVAMRYLEEMT